jgi:hypothetical protein
MLTTYPHGSPRVEVIDSTVFVSSGGVRLGNTFFPYPGGQITFNSMIHYSGDSSKYQNSLLYLNAVGQAADMTTSVSTPVVTQRELTLPVLPTDSSHVYSEAYPLGLFTFLSNDGTNAIYQSHVSI